MKYEEPKMSIVLETEDVIRTSPQGTTPEGDGPDWDL